MHTVSTSSLIPSNTDTIAHHDHDVSNVLHTAQLACINALFCIQHGKIICLNASQEQTGRWPLLLSWVLDSLSHQMPLPVAQYEERGQLRDTIPLKLA